MHYSHQQQSQPRAFFIRSFFIPRVSLLSWRVQASCSLELKRQGWVELESCFRGNWKVPYFLMTKSYNGSNTTLFPEYTRIISFSFLFMFRELKHGCWNGFQAICMLCHPSIPITVFELDEFFTSSWLTTLFYDGGKNPFGAS